MSIQGETKLILILEIIFSLIKNVKVINASIDKDQDTRIMTQSASPYPNGMYKLISKYYDDIDDHIASTKIFLNMKVRGRDVEF